MSDMVWISMAPGHVSNMRPFKSSFGFCEMATVENFDRNRDGEPLPAGSFPAEICGISSARESNYHLPDLCRLAGYWVIRATTSDVLQQFDLGDGGFYPVNVLKKDQQTPVGGEWACLNFGNKKAAFLVEQSENAREDYIRNGEKGWFPGWSLKDDQFSVSPVALEGPDIWVDPDVGDAFFVSDRLRRALKKAKADKGFFFKRCRVI